MGITSPFDNTRWITTNDRLRRDIPGDDRTGGDERIGTNTKSRTDHGTCSNGRSPLDNRHEKLEIPISALRIPIVREADIRPDENIVLDTQTVPQLDTGLHRNSISNHYIVFDETVRADIHVGPDAGTWQDDDELPYASVRADLSRLDIRKWVYKETHRNSSARSLPMLAESIVAIIMVTADFAWPFISSARSATTGTHRNRSF
jgi:hypothetical protein